jgi:hypothetical protein
MKALLICSLLAFVLSEGIQEPCPAPPWSFSIGVQMPTAVRGKQLVQVTLYPDPPASVTPECEVTLATKNAAVVDIQTGYITIVGTPETRIDVSCTLPEEKQ